MKMKPIAAYLALMGLHLSAIHPEVEKLEAVPEHLRPYYELDPATKKYKMNFEKVDIEDTVGLKNAAAEARREAKEAKAAREAAIREALKPYEGIDPVKTKELLAKFQDQDEAALIAAGNVDEVVKRRVQKFTEAKEKEIQEAMEREEGALEVAATFMEKVLDNQIRAAAIEVGLHPSAIDDALLRAREIFSLNDEGNAVQYEDDGETIVMGADQKTPYSPKEWLEGMKTKAPHWFPAGASGGGAHGEGRNKGGRDLSGLSPTARLTAAREQQPNARK